MNITRRINHLAQSHGLVVRGGFTVEEDDRVPEIQPGVAASELVLFGNAGSSLWEKFSASAEYSDGLEDPLNRWSERIGKQIAREVSGLALFPFGGPPYQPFIRWASKAESLNSSKLGILIHPRYGLWHAYRFAVALPEPESFLPTEETTRVAETDICEKCIEQPCLKTCPVDAFTVSGYKVAACYGFLTDNPQSDCRKTTCQARLSCPEGKNFHYQQQHAQFHMDAFINSMADRFDGKGTSD
jgi:ferredoxin-like protein FixX